MRVGEADTDDVLLEAPRAVRGEEAALAEASLEDACAVVRAACVEPLDDGAHVHYVGRHTRSAAIGVSHGAVRSTEAPRAVVRCGSADESEAALRSLSCPLLTAEKCRTSVNAMHHDEDGSRLVISSWCHVYEAPLTEPLDDASLSGAHEKMCGVHRN